ncbi:Odorant receptor 49a [Carabus blaptoides fortunei]
MLKYLLLSVGDNEDEAFDIVKESVRHHNMLLKFVQDLERIVTIPILKQYLDAIACMGLYLYMLQVDFQFLHLFSLLTNLSQTLFFSIFGQLIQDKSLAIADAAYESNWQNLQNRKVRKAVILIIQRAQARSQITAGGFITLSFESFAVMLKTAASFLAVLRSSKEN